MLRMKFERIKRGITQDGLGFTCGVSQGLISGFENGKFKPLPDHLEKIAQALSVSPASILLKPVTILESEVEPND